MAFQLLHRLPEELLQIVVDSLTQQDLKCLNLASKWTYSVATPLIWREVNLVDCRTRHSEHQLRPETDEHDDTPLLRKAVLLAK